MNTIEMHGFLTGKCLPGDMRVNETTAEYLVRKISEKDERLAAVVAERDAALNAERTWETAMMGVCGEDGPASVAAVIKALASENAAMKAAHPQPFGPEMMKALDAYEKHQDEVPETGMLDAFFILRDSIRVETPATDAAVSAIEARGVEKLAERWRTAAKLAGDDGESRAAFGLAFDAKRAAQFAAELREGK